MTFVDLRKSIDPLRKKEYRFDLGDYLEFVISAADIDLVTAVLEQFFGRPAKPVGAWPSEELASSVEKFGGIRPDQTLYLYQQNGTLCYAMIWPWADKNSATVRISNVKAHAYPSRAG